MSLKGFFSQALVGVVFYYWGDTKVLFKRTRDFTERGRRSRECVCVWKSEEGGAFELLVVLQSIFGNIYLVFVPNSQYRTPKTLGIT